MVLGALAVCAAVLTSACAAGRHAPTAEESGAIDGVGASVGSMLLREVAVAAPPNGISYAKGDAAVLRLVVVNNGQSSDQLVSITTPAAVGVSVFASLQDAAGVVSTSSPTSCPSDTSSAQYTACAVASPPAFTPVPVTALGRVPFGINGTDKVLVLSGLTDTLFPAALIPVTFTFQSAGSVTVQVPVQLTSSATPTGEVVSDTASTTPGI